jgi:hypothetical protein
MPDLLQRGYRVRELAKLLRKGRGWVLAEIQGGRMPALDLGEHGRHRYIVLPSQLEQWMRSREAVPTPPRTRRQKRTQMVDYYPGD